MDYSNQIKDEFMSQEIVDDTMFDDPADDFILPSQSSERSESCNIEITRTNATSELRRSQVVDETVVEYEEMDELNDYNLPTQGLTPHVPESADLFGTQTQAYYVDESLFAATPLIGGQAVIPETPVGARTCDDSFLKTPRLSLLNVSAACNMGARDRLMCGSEADTQPSAVDSTIILESDDDSPAKVKNLKPISRGKVFYEINESADKDTEEEMSINDSVLEIKTCDDRLVNLDNSVNVLTAKLNLNEVKTGAESSQNSIEGAKTHFKTKLDDVTCKTLYQHGNFLGDGNNVVEDRMPEEVENKSIALNFEEKESEIIPENNPSPSILKETVSKNEFSKSNCMPFPSENSCLASTIVESNEEMKPPTNVDVKCSVAFNDQTKGTNEIKQSNILEGISEKEQIEEKKDSSCLLHESFHTAAETTPDTEAAVQSPENEANDADDVKDTPQMSRKNFTFLLEVVASVEVCTSTNHLLKKEIISAKDKTVLYNHPMLESWSESTDKSKRESMSSAGSVYSDKADLPFALRRRISLASVQTSSTSTVEDVPVNVINKVQLDDVQPWKNDCILSLACDEALGRSLALTHLSKTRYQIKTNSKPSRLLQATKDSVDSLPESAKYVQSTAAGVYSKITPLEKSTPVPAETPMNVEEVTTVSIVEKTPTGRKRTRAVGKRRKDSAIPETETTTDDNTPAKKMALEVESTEMVAEVKRSSRKRKQIDGEKETKPSEGAAGKRSVRKRNMHSSSETPEKTKADDEECQKETKMLRNNEEVSLNFNDSPSLRTKASLKQYQVSIEPELKRLNELKSPPCQSDDVASLRTKASLKLYLETKNDDEVTKELETEPGEMGSCCKSEDSVNNKTGLEHGTLSKEPELTVVGSQQQQQQLSTPTPTSSGRTPSSRTVRSRREPGAGAGGGTPTSSSGGRAAANRRRRGAAVDSSTESSAGESSRRKKVSRVMTYDLEYTPGLEMDETVANRLVPITKATPGRSSKSRKKIFEVAEDPDVVRRLGPIPTSTHKIFSGLGFLLCYVKPRKRPALRSAAAAAQTSSRSDFSLSETEDSQLYDKHHNFQFDEARLRRQITAGGGVVYDHFSQIPPAKYATTRLVTNRPNRSAKFLLCFIFNVPIVLHWHIIEACRSGNFNAMKLHHVGWSEASQRWLDKPKLIHKTFFGKHIYLHFKSEDEEADFLFEKFWTIVLEKAGGKMTQDPNYADIIIADTSLPQEIQNSVLALAGNGPTLVSINWAIESLLHGYPLESSSHPSFAYDIDTYPS